MGRVPGGEAEGPLSLPLLPCSLTRKLITPLWWTQIDYNKLTTLLGSKSVASATKTYQNALKKLVGSDVSSLPTAGGGEKAGTPAGKKKRAASETADADDGETPKKKRGRKPKAKAEAEEAEKGEEVKDEGEGEGVKDEPVSDGEEI